MSDHSDRSAAAPENPRAVENDDYDYEYVDPDDWGCTHCGGEGLAECDDFIQCMAPSHIGNDYDLWCACKACGGTGRGKDQTVW